MSKVQKIYQDWQAPCHQVDPLMDGAPVQPEPSTIEIVTAVICGLVICSVAIWEYLL